MPGNEFYANTQLQTTTTTQQTQTNSYIPQQNPHCSYQQYYDHTTRQTLSNPVILPEETTLEQITSQNYCNYTQPLKLPHLPPLSPTSVVNVYSPPVITPDIIPAIAPDVLDRVKNMLKEFKKIKEILITLEHLQKYNLTPLVYYCDVQDKKCCRCNQDNQCYCIFNDKITNIDYCYNCYLWNIYDTHVSEYAKSIELKTLFDQQYLSLVQLTIKHIPNFNVTKLSTQKIKCLIPTCANKVMSYDYKTETMCLKCYIKTSLEKYQSLPLFESAKTNIKNTKTKILTLSMSNQELLDFCYIDKKDIRISDRPTRCNANFSCQKKVCDVLMLNTQTKTPTYINQNVCSRHFLVSVFNEIKNIKKRSLSFRIRKVKELSNKLVLLKQCLTQCQKRYTKQKNDKTISQEDSKKYQQRISFYKRQIKNLEKHIQDSNKQIKQK